MLRNLQLWDLICLDSAKWIVRHSYDCPSLLINNDNGLSLYLRCSSTQDDCLKLWGAPWGVKGNPTIATYAVFQPDHVKHMHHILSTILYNLALKETQIIYICFGKPVVLFIPLHCHFDLLHGHSIFSACRSSSFQMLVPVLGTVSKLQMLSF
jgi:hypothetical protein